LQSSATLSAETGASYDDWISLAAFECAFRDFSGNIYVIGPQPSPLSEMLAERLRSTRVIGIRAYWNVLSHALLQVARDGTQQRSLNWPCEDILDRLGDRVAFPLKHDPAV
jgi:hypothetical protein